MVHTLSLDNYTPTPRKLVLGTNSSYGIESIKIERGAGWDGLNLTATWHIPGREEPLRVALLDGDAMDVPPEVTKEAKDGVLVLAGLGPGVQRASCNVEYYILKQAGIYGSADAEPTPELAAQVLEAALQAKADAEAAAEDAAAAKANADKAQADAEKAQQAAENAAADAAKAGPYAEAARAAQEAAESARDEAIAAQRAAENAAAAAAASKIAADTLAAEAARAAKAAENSKAAANNAANFAGENATAAQQAAGTATAAANDAGQSASDAAASKAAAETAAKASQNAQTATAAAKEEAVKAQGAAQTAAKSAQDAQAAAEKVRDDAKTAQKGAEDARDTAAKSAEAAAKSEANAKQSADTLAESVENVVANTAAVAELKEKKAEIDDTVVGANTWSSKHIIDMLCPPLEESGNPVVCYPVAGYPLGVKASWEPVQEGTGTPYPAGGGKQLLDTNKCVPTVGKPYGMTITLDGDVFKVSGVPNEEVTETGVYSFAVCTCNQEELRGKGYKVTAWAIKGKVNGTWGLRTESESALAIAAELTPGVNNDIQLRLMVSKDTPTAWEPYENIRPIKGRDSVTVERCGENLIKFPYYTPTARRNGLVMTSQQDGSVTINGTATADTWFVLGVGVEKRLPMNTPMALSGCPAGGSTKTYYIGLYLGGKWFADSGNGNTDVKFTTREVASRVEASIVKGTVCNNLTFYPKIEVGTTITPYSKYQSTTNTLTLPETVYGGEVDAVSGEGHKTWDFKELKIADMNNLDAFPGWKNQDWLEPYKGTASFGILPGTICNCTSRNKAKYNGNTLYFETSAFNGLTQGELIEKYPDLILQIALLRNAPTPFTATGAQPLPALGGANTVLTDADSATVTGRADPIKRITDLEDAVASQT